MKQKSIAIFILVVLISITVACSNEDSPDGLSNGREMQSNQSADTLYQQPPPSHKQDDEQELTDTVIPGETPDISDTPEATPSPTPEAVHTPEQDSGRIVIAIDPGHQRRGNYTQERIGPGTTQTKPMVSSGTSGVATKVPEYELTLEISLQLRDELIARGYEVFMIRESHDVNISNRTRAEMAAEAGANIFIRIHANGSDDSSANGILTISPTFHTPFIPDLYSRCNMLAQCVLDEMIEATGAKNRGIWETDSMTGINWSTIPVTIVELGFMTNPAEDRLMQTPEYQQKLVEGIANGIDLFFIVDVVVD